LPVNQLERKAQVSTALFMGEHAECRAFRLCWLRPGSGCCWRPSTVSGIVTWNWLR